MTKRSAGSPTAPRIDRWEVEATSPMEALEEQATIPRLRSPFYRPDPPPAQTHASAAPTWGPPSVPPSADWKTPWERWNERHAPEETRRPPRAAPAVVSAVVLAEPSVPLERLEDEADTRPRLAHVERMPPRPEASRAIRADPDVDLPGGGSGAHGIDAVRRAAIVVGALWVSVLIAGAVAAGLFTAWVIAWDGG